MRRLLPIAFLLAAAAACAGGGGGKTSPSNPVIGALNKTESVGLTIVVPNASSTAAKNGAKPNYIAPGTQSVAVEVYTVNGATPSPTIAPTIEQISATAPGCTTVSTGLSCTFTVPVPISQSVVLEILSYTSTDGSGTPIAQGFLGPINTTVAITTPLGVSLGGVISSIVASPAALQPPANGTTQTLSITVTAKDANGNVIIPPGNYPTPIALSVASDPNGAISFSPNPIVSPAANGATTVTVTYNSAKAIGVTSLIATAGSISADVAFSPQGSGGGTTTAGYRVSEYPIPTTNSGPSAIAVGPGGDNVWFTEQTANQVGKLFTGSCGESSCTIIEGSLPEAIAPDAIAAGTDGNVWVGGTAPAATSHVTVLTPGACATQSATNLNACAKYEEPDPVTAPSITDIKAGNDNLMHAAATSSGSGYILTYFPSQQPAVYYTAEDYTTGSVPHALTANDWFSDSGADQTGTFSCYEGCSVTSYAFVANGAPSGIANDAAGRVYVGDTNNNEIVYFQTSTCPSTCSFWPVAIPTANAMPKTLALGPDGNIWFTEFAGNKIGILVTSSMTITELTIPTANSGPSGIVMGPDGNMYFTEFNTNKIGVITP
jgi:virginiamycin B lyase